MSLKLAVDCDSCSRGIDEGDRVVCWKCYAEAADGLDDANKRIDELEDALADEAKELRIRNTEPQDNAPSEAVKSE